MKSERNKKTILLKVTGELLEFSSKNPKTIETSLIENLARQIKILTDNFSFGIVVGGGNILRGNDQSGHYAGMLATMINGLIIQDTFVKLGISTALFSGLSCPEVAFDISPQNIRNAKKNSSCLIFSGGTGNPYFTTDTNAVIRALQIDADELWKGTKTNGIYSKDPNKYPDAKMLSSISHDYALKQNLKILDRSAFSLAEAHKLKIRVFNIFDKSSLLNVAEDSTYGSTVSSN